MVKLSRPVLIILMFLSLGLIIFLIMIIFPNHKPPEIIDICEDNPNYVVRVIDGDTFEICSGDKIRMLCVDTPEKGKEGYEEAKFVLEDAILHKIVQLKASNYNGPDKDKYDRLLRWVYIEDEEDSTKQILINRYVLEEGQGDILIIPPETCDEVSD